ncbi:hypothetical protein L4D15_19365 [Enterovibrio norvegicus]|uniref:hypothetical protein n=1 Tax=Enterovibrio norvegicus TaxID=188144 RepID=UPI003D0D4D52
MNNSSEAHLFIIWKNARYKEDEFIKEIGEKLRIVEVYEIDWSDEYYSSNLTRFYGQKLPNRSFKEKHCGKGEFLLIICEDNTPVYKERDTISRDIESVNSNVFDLKQKFRNMTGGGHKIHATNNQIETNHDLTLLLGVNVSDYDISNRESWNGNIVKLSQDLVGANGWVSAEQLFYTLNACEDYVVLRNFESLPNELTLLGHDDIDFLARNYTNMMFTLNGIKIYNKKYRVHYKLTIEGKEILCDIRYVGDGYYDKKWQENILDTKVKFNDIYIPNSTNHINSVLYHALIHKKEMASDYVLKLSKWFGNDCRITLRSKLESYMNDQGYTFTEPKDYSVFYTISRKSLRRKIFYLWLGLKIKLRGYLCV